MWKWWSENGGAVVVALAGILSFGVGLSAITVDSKIENDHRVSLQGGDLVVKGMIGDRLAALIEEKLADGGVTRVVFDSRGGKPEAAKRIAQALSEHGTAFHVTGACRSACVAIFASVKNRSADADAVFLFHRGAGVGLLRPSEWARAISPRLDAFLDSCSPNPTTQAEGVGLTWAQMEKIMAGRPAESCEDLRERWRMREARA